MHGISAEADVGPWIIGRARFESQDGASSANSEVPKVRHAFQFYLQTDEVVFG